MIGELGSDDCLSTRIGLGFRTADGLGMEGGGGYGGLSDGE